MKVPVIAFLFVILFGWNSFAWEVEIGVRQQMPRIGVGEQEYEDDAGEKRSIKPEIETTAIGQAYHLGLRFESFFIDMDVSQFKYDSSIDASNDAVSTDTDITATTRETRIGVNYYLERELAGILAGGGFSQIEEILESNNNTWTHKTVSPYLKFGFDLIFYSFRVRYEQTYLGIGEHSVQINSIGFFLTF